jgi:hypothetical protein
VFASDKSWRINRFITNRCCASCDDASSGSMEYREGRVLLGSDHFWRCTWGGFDVEGHVPMKTTRLNGDALRICSTSHGRVRTGCRRGEKVHVSP